MTTLENLSPKNGPENGIITLNKALITNISALSLILISFMTPLYSKQVLNMGLYALSGAITNWLAVYMLFEKIPFLYGSGIIPAKFQEFKKGIFSLIMDEFFNEENIQRFLENTETALMNQQSREDLIESIDYQKLFSKLKEVIMQSPYGGMVTMMGGEKALDGLEAPFINKMKITIEDILTSESFHKALQKLMGGGKGAMHLKKSVEQIVSARLAELTPQHVKDIIQNMIRSHLGWLVVWGGVFGGLIGLLASFL